MKTATRLAPHVVLLLIEHGVSQDSLPDHEQRRRFSEIWDSLVETYVQAVWAKYPGQASPGRVLEKKLESRGIPPLLPDEADQLLLALIQVENLQNTSQTGV